LISRSDLVPKILANPLAIKSSMVWSVPISGLKNTSFF
jgi:hypothetical protein